MRIEEYLNTTEADIKAKKHNIWLGLSLGNKYWTENNIRTYLHWALENTKEKVAILIPDKIQAINYEVKNGYTSARALAVALRKGKEIEAVVRKIIAEDNLLESKIEIVHWEQTEDEEHKRIREIVREEFESNLEFRKTVIETVRDVPHMQSLDLSEEQYVRLTKYVLDEMPVLLNGFKVHDSGFRYDLLPYPGLAKIDYLRNDLLSGISFPELTKRLNIQQKIGLLAAYADE